MANFTDEDFDRPLVKDLSGLSLGAKKGKIVKSQKYFLDELTYDDIDRSKYLNEPGLDHLERKWLQIAIATGNEELQKEFGPYIHDGVYVDTDV